MKNNWYKISQNEERYYYISMNPAQPKFQLRLGKAIPMFHLASDVENGIKGTTITLKKEQINPQSIVNYNDFEKDLKNIPEGVNVFF